MALLRCMLPWALGVLLTTGGCQNGKERQSSTKRSQTRDASSRVKPSRARPAGLTLRFFAAGRADAMLLRTAQHAVAVDLGLVLGGRYLVKERLVPFLKQAGVGRLTLIITHPHPDHVGDPVLLRRHVAFDALHTNLDGVALLKSLLPDLKQAAGRSVPLKLLHRGHRLTFGRLSLQVLHPPDNAPPAAQVSSRRQQNNRSLVIRATYGQVRFLLGGDLMHEGEAALLNSGQPLAADVLKLGHHGRLSTSDAWLERVKPRYAVAPIGKLFGRTRRIRPRLLKRLARRSIRLLRTDRDGDIAFQTDGQTLTVRTHPRYKY